MDCTGELEEKLLLLVKRIKGIKIRLGPQYKVEQGILI